MEMDFLARANHFLPFFQTAVNCCSWKQFFFNWNSENEFFVDWKQCFSFQAFFLLIEDITEI